MKGKAELTEPRALRALAHPIRLALVGLLREHGSLTATQAAKLLDLNSGSCSFHLRQLAKYGLVEEVPTPGRQKPWRATAAMTSWPDVGVGPEMADASQLLSGVLAQGYLERMLAWLDRRQDEPEDWQEAAYFGDLLLHLTAEELTAFEQQVLDLAAPYQQRLFEPGSRPPGSRAVTVLHVAIPRKDDSTT